MSYSLAFTQAITTVIFIADKIRQGMFDFVPTKEVSNSLNLANPTVVKVLQGLTKAGIIESREGAKGGVRLAVQPDKLTVLDIFYAIEQDRPLFRSYFQINAIGKRPTNAQNAIIDTLNAAEKAMKMTLKDVLLKDLLDRVSE